MFGGFYLYLLLIVLEIFRKNYFINTILLLPYLLVVRLGLFFYLPEISDKDVELYRISTWTGLVDYPVVNLVLSHLLIFVHVLMINYLHIHHKLSRSSSLFAGLFYILWMSITPFKGVSDILIANTFVILALANVWRCYKLNNITVYTFNAGILIGFAGLIFLPYAIFLFFLLVSLSVISILKFKNVLQLWVSFAIPWFLWFTYHYWYSMPLDFMDIVRFFGFKRSWSEMSGSWTTWAGGLVYMVIFFLALIWYVDIKSKKSIESQKKLLLCLFFYFFPEL